MVERDVLIALQVVREYVSRLGTSGSTWAAPFLEQSGPENGYEKNSSALGVPDVFRSFGKFRAVSANLRAARAAHA
jgi:hypothetical protein